jgi:hypothetical protein
MEVENEGVNKQTSTAAVEMATAAEDEIDRLS